MALTIGELSGAQYAFLVAAIDHHHALERAELEEMTSKTRGGRRATPLKRRPR